ncbi:hypothetical protein SALBM311S_13019 [Streptomyces alboniger]
MRGTLRTPSPWSTGTNASATRTSTPRPEVLALRLRERGAGPGRLIPVVLPRSAQLVAVLLGILKCGAAYAALDVRWPRARVRALLDLIDPPLVVTRDPLPGASSPTWAPPAGPPRRSAGTCSDVLPRIDVAPGDPATVFFTSGTSGRPKAVVSPHRATTRLTPTTALWSGPGRVTTQAAPVSWDAFSLEVWGTLTAGEPVSWSRPPAFFRPRSAPWCARPTSAPSS